MKIYKSCIIFILFTLFSLSTYSQSNLFELADLSSVNTDSYTDTQLVDFYNRITEMKISEDQAYRILQSKGLPESEVEKLRARWVKINTAKIAGAVSTPTLENSRTYDSAVNRVPMEDVNRDLTIFGSELFMKSSLVFVPNLRIATPSSYILGPDDEIVLSVYGFSEKKYNLIVNEEGEIYIPNVGPILVSGLSIQEATQKIKAKLASTIYRAISSGQTQIQVSLGKIRSIRVTVIGQAYKPGTFTVSSLTTLYNLLYLCGGPSDMGSFRTIEVIRGNEVVRKADLYAFLVNGNQKDNMLLQEGDVIRIPYYQNRVKLSGDVKREGKYEMMTDETFNDLLQYSGGFNDFAFRASVKVVRITDKEKKIIDLNSSMFSGFELKGGDEFFIGRLQEKISNRVSITGSVARPGDYELSDGLTLELLIDKAGGITEDAFTERISVFRYLKNNMPSVISINLDSLKQSEFGLSLSKNDSISVHSIFDFADFQYVTIEGNVRRPGTTPFRENLSLKDVLLDAGGINSFGDSSAIEISRRIRDADVSSLSYSETENLTVSISPDYRLSSDVTLKPFDVITVRSLPGMAPQRSVTIIGEVIVPGKYNLLKSGDRITDIISRVGGFRASADSNAITIRRLRRSNLSLEEREALFKRLLNLDSDSLASNQRLSSELYKSYELVSVNLKAALTQPQSSENLVLEDGDILTVDKKNNLIKVSGEVYYPTIIPIKPGKSAKYYITLAGSFMPSARKSGSLVIYPDGKAKTVKSFLGIKSYPTVTSRSEIFVPQKSRSNRNRVSLGEWSIILSSLAILANLITNITK